MNNDIEYLKSKIVGNQRLSNTQTQRMINEIGRLLNENNRRSGANEDVRYLYSDDGEFSRHVAGFVGDKTDTVDQRGLPLHVGDTVANTVDGKTNERMVILGSSGRPVLDQKWLNEHHAVKVESFVELDLKSANINPGETITAHSCVEEYNKLPIEMKHKLSMNGMKM